MIRILGIDPGTTTVGFAIIDKEKQDYNIIDFGVFQLLQKYL
ncbi:MAG: crossover junction endodeoxyribonuclease RuvC [Candidatus Gracilibacteria bacterium]|nr:crossover junction endodeoxyribonuclease RuvC [Candidatus Gracilibacteria bacterium]